MGWWIGGFAVFLVFMFIGIGIGIGISVSTDAVDSTGEKGPMPKRHGGFAQRVTGGKS